MVPQRGPAVMAHWCTAYKAQMVQSGHAMQMQPEAGMPGPASVCADELAKLCTDIDTLRQHILQIHADSQVTNKRLWMTDGQIQLCK